jgi:hypothetical protein
MNIKMKHDGISGDDNDAPLTLHVKVHSLFILKHNTAPFSMFDYTVLTTYQVPLVCMIGGGGQRIDMI